MNFKKISALALSTMLCVGSVAPAYANEVTDSYFDNYKKVNEWNQMKTDSKTKLDVKIVDEESKNVNVDLKISSSYDKDTQKGDIKVKFISKADIAYANISLPDIHLILDRDNLYVNKDFMNELSKMMSLEKSFTKDYVKIVLSDEDKQKIGLTPEMIKSASSNETAEKALKFLKKINIGVDLGLQKNDNTYTLFMDEKKIVDVVNGYFKFIFANPDIFVDFYKDTFNMDLIETSGLTKEEFKSSMVEAINMWKKEVEPLLPKIKEVLKGTTITGMEKFEDEKFLSNIDMSLVVDIAKAKELFMGEKSTIPMKFVASLKKQDVSEKVNSIDVKLPTNAEEFNVSEYIKQKEEEMRKLSVLEIKITPSKKLLQLTQFGETTSIENVNVKVKKGNLYVDTQLLIDNLGFDLDVEKDGKYVQFRKVMQDNGYTVTYDTKTKTAIATSSI